MRDALGTHYGITDSQDFLLLSTLEARPAQVFLATCQRMRARIVCNLGSLADQGWWGRHVVMVFDDPDDYYDYVGHYYPDGGEYAMSSGMFIQAGYGHFLMPLEQIDAMEPVIAHELTHCLLTHLPIPAWLNEGLAVNTEHTMFPQLASPQAQLYFPHEVAAQHARRPIGVAHEQRLVEAELLPERRHRGGGGALAEDRLGRVSRQQVDGEEDQQRVLVQGA